MSDLHHIMERVGRIVAADQLLQVDVRGVRAFATRGRVVLPAIENYDWLGAHAGRMLHGMLDHECGHASFTNFDVVDRIVDEETPAFKALWNALEDGMIERLKGEEFRGCAQNIEQLHDWFWEHGADGDSPIYDVIKHHPDLWTAFCLSVNTVVTPYGGHPIETIEELHPDAGAMLREVEAELVKVATATTTEEIFAITKTIYEWFAQEAEATPPEPEESDCDEDGAGDTSDDSSDEQGDAEDPFDCDDDGGDDDADDDGDDSGLRVCDEASDEDASEDEKAEAGSGSEVEPDDDADADTKAARSKSPIVERDLERWNRDGTPLNPSDAVQVRVRNVFEQPRYTQPYTVFSHEFDLVRDFSAENVVTGNQFARDMQDARTASEALAIAFESALRAKRDLRAVGGYDEGLVDPDLLGEYAVGSCPSDQLYQQYVAEDSDDVAVSILLDCSGSMGNGPGSKSHLAKLTALALHQALASCQIEHEITGFTTYESVYGNAWVHGDESFRVHAQETMAKARTALEEAKAQGTDITKFARIYRDSFYQVPVYGVFKSFGATDARGLENVAGISHNLDGEAVLWQANRLAERGEKRRVMFVLSDGNPEGSCDNAQGARYLHEAVDRVLASGIEIYGIGMDSAAVRSFYPEHWVCSDMQDLGRLAMTAMTDVLLRSRTERAWVKVA